MTKSKNVGVLVAGMVAGLILSGGAAAAADEGGTSAPAKVKCSGGNACKGQSACSSDANACKGQNGCKGKGWTMSTDDECTKAGGKAVKE